MSSPAVQIPGKPASAQSTFNQHATFGSARPGDARSADVESSFAPKLSVARRSLERSARDTARDTARTAPDEDRGTVRDEREANPARDAAHAAGQPNSSQPNPIQQRVSSADRTDGDGEGPVSDSRGQEAVAEASARPMAGHRGLAMTGELEAITGDGTDQLSEHPSSVPVADRLSDSQGESPSLADTWSTTVRSGDVARLGVAASDGPAALTNPLSTLTVDALNGASSKDALGQHAASEDGAAEDLSPTVGLKAPGTEDWIPTDSTEVSTADSDAGPDAGFDVGAIDQGGADGTTPDATGPGQDRGASDTADDGANEVVAGGEAEGDPLTADSAQATPRTENPTRIDADGNRLAAVNGKDPVGPTQSATPTQALSSENLDAETRSALWQQLEGALGRARAGLDGNEVRIRLRPADLGELLVQVQTRGEHVTVRLVASSEAAQQALLLDRQRLTAELVKAGFSDGFVDVSQDDLAGRDQRQGDQGGSSSSNSLFPTGAVAELDWRTDQPLERLPTNVGRQSSVNVTL
ncbi:MAG: hypothetical protein ACI8TP_000529 [Acidimicrobiales bacterium]|jgi:hypothetical protein